MGVHNCNLEVKAGEIVVLMGLSGSGKSTLLRAVNRLNPIRRGKMWVNDKQKLVDIAQISTQELRSLRRHQIAMVFQQFALFPWRTVRENIAFGLEIAKVAKPELNQKVDEKIKLVGLGDWEHRKLSELSGGMQQRVGLARALASEAPILLMDEPFSALDPLIRLGLQEELLTLQQNLQRTILFVSHDLDEALRIGNRIAIMEGGRILQIGTPQEIVLTPINEHVAAFVANMNPLKAISGRELQAFITKGDHPPKGAHILSLSSKLEVLIEARSISGQNVWLKNPVNDQVLGYLEDKVIFKALCPSGFENPH